MDRKLLESLKKLQEHECPDCGKAQLEKEYTDDKTKTGGQAYSYGCPACGKGFYRDKIEKKVAEAEEDVMAAKNDRTGLDKQDEIEDKAETKASAVSPDEEDEDISPEGNKEYLGNNGSDMFFYLVKTPNETDGTKDIQVTDSSGKTLFSAVENNVPIDNVKNFLTQALQKVDIANLSFDVVMKYLVPAEEKSEEEIEDDKTGGEEAKLDSPENSKDRQDGISAPPMPVGVGSRMGEAKVKEDTEYNYELNNAKTRSEFLGSWIDVYVGGVSDQRLKELKALVKSDPKGLMAKMKMPKDAQPFLRSELEEIADAINSEMEYRFGGETDVTVEGLREKFGLKEDFADDWKVGDYIDQLGTIVEITPKAVRFKKDDGRITSLWRVEFPAHLAQKMGVKKSRGRLHNVNMDKLYKTGDIDQATEAKLREKFKLNELAKDYKYKITAYQYDELSPEAQEAAIESMSDINVEHDWWMYDEIYNEIAKDYGVEIDMKGVSFDLDRGAYVAFDTYNHSKSANWKSPIFIQNPELFCQKAGVKYNQENSIGIDHQHYAGGVIANTITTDYAEEEALQKCLDNMLNEILKALSTDYEHLTSSEGIADTIRSNEIEFTVDGKPFNTPNKGTAIESKVKKFKCPNCGYTNKGPFKDDTCPKCKTDLTMHGGDEVDEAKEVWVIIDQDKGERVGGRYDSKKDAEAWLAGMSHIKKDHPNLDIQRNESKDPYAPHLEGTCDVCGKEPTKFAGGPGTEYCSIECLEKAEGKKVPNESKVSEIKYKVSIPGLVAGQETVATSESDALGKVISSICDKANGGTKYFGTEINSKNKAILIAQVREKPSSFNVKKIGEAKVNEALLGDLDYKQFKGAQIDAVIVNQHMGQGGTIVDAVEINTDAGTIGIWGSQVYASITGGGQSQREAKVTEADRGRPEYGKVYSLTGGHGQKSIAGGNTWKESEVRYGCKKCGGHFGHNETGEGKICPTCKDGSNLELVKENKIIEARVAIAELVQDIIEYIEEEFGGKAKAIDYIDVVNVVQEWFESIEEDVTSGIIAGLRMKKWGVRETKVNETYARYRASINFEITADRNNEELKQEIVNALMKIQGLDTSINNVILKQEGSEGKVPTDPSTNPEGYMGDLMEKFGLTEKKVPTCPDCGNQPSGEHDMPNSDDFVKMGNEWHCGACGNSSKKANYEEQRERQDESKIKEEERRASLLGNIDSEEKAKQCQQRRQFKGIETEIVPDDYNPGKFRLVKKEIKEADEINNVPPAKADAGVPKVETPGQPVATDQPRVAKHSNPEEAQAQIRMDYPEEPYTSTALAYADLIVDEPKVFGAIRQLKWPGIYSNGETFLKQVKIIDHYNKFTKEVAQRLVDKFGDEAKYKLARENSVCVYVTVLSPELQISMLGLKDLVSADEVTKTTQPGELRFWWD
jgi:rubrerythrin